MRLTDCDARFWTLYSGNRHGIGVMFECPKCVKAGLPKEKRTLAPVRFANPIDGGPPENRPGVPAWQRTGDTLETLTLSPSVDMSRSHNKPNPPHADGHIGWHGHIINGEIVGDI